MVRLRFAAALVLVAFVPLVAVGEEPTTRTTRILPITTDLVADVDSQADPGYAEPEANMPCCPCETDCCGPLWTVRAGAIFLSRNQARAQPPVTVDIMRQEVFDLSHSGMGTAAGPDITLGRCLDSCWDIEARYFQVDGWGKTHVFSSPAGVSVLAYDTTASAYAQSLDYTSRLYNTEVNLRYKQYERLPLIAGFRALQLDEHFYISASDPPLGVGADTSTNNFLYGFQVGAEPVLWDNCGRFRLEGLLKTGIYGNRAHQNTTFPRVAVGQENQQDVASFVGELGLTGVWALNKCWSLRGGYEVMWITNVVLAPDQASTIAFGVPPTGTIYDKATVFYYGATAALERRF